ncbi:MAG: hypothetical protein K8R54_02380 [Bacteroidales bacterium]|nr:hypothetical protein [Bacteroidales bacterium]
MIFSKKIFIVLSFIVICKNISAQDSKANFTGFVDTYHAVRSQSSYDFMSSRTRFRGELKMLKGNSYFFTSFNAVHNSILKSQTGIELREAFFEYSAKSWDLKAGRQIVSWGVADGMRITDIISPMDMTEFLAQDYDDIKMPGNAIKLRWLKPKMNFELIYIPVPSFFIIPDEAENPWSVFPTEGKPVFDINSDNKPELTLANSEYGARFSFFLSGIDFSVSALHTWNKMPVFSRSMSPDFDTVFVKANHYNLDMLGLDFSIPKGQFVFRGEAAYYIGEFHELNEQNINIEPVKKNSLNCLIGIDRYPGNDWTITAQYSHKFITDYIDILQEKENTVLLTAGITKKLFRSTLSLSTFAYVDVNNGGFFDRNSIDYALSDEIHIMIGYDWFQGDKGMFGLYKNNSEIWLKAKLSF